MIERPKPKGYWALLLVVLHVLTMPAFAQENQPGRTASVGGTDIGERQEREEAASNIQPARRISNRVQNRVQSRIRNRIDRDYNPQGSATSPFEIAAEQGDAARRRAQQQGSLNSD